MKPFIAGVLVLTALTSVSAQDILNRAKGALSTGDTSAAVAAFQEAVRTGQKVAEANYYLGAIALARGQAKDAIRYLSTSVDADDDNVDALKLAGDAHIAGGDVQGALPHYRNAAKLSPKDPNIAAAYGTALLAADSIDAAIVRISSAIILNPDNPVLLTALGDAYMKQNVTALAITNYQKAIELAPAEFGTRFKLARTFEKEKKWTDAVREYREVQSRDSTLADAYLGEGAIWFKAKRHKDAIKPLKKYVELRPASFEGMSLLAESMVEAKDPAAADYAFRAVSLDSTAANIWRVYFYALVDKKDFSEAERALRSLEKRDTLVVDDYLKLGSLYYGLGREEDAMNWYLKAIAADSANCDPYFNLGSLYMKKQDYANAVLMFDRKIECDPRSLTAYLNSGICSLTMKDFPAARAKLTKVVSLKPDYYNGRLWLARYYTQVDSLDLAMEQYDQVLKQVADQPDKRNVAGEAYFSKGATYFIRQSFGPAAEMFRKALTYGYDTDGLHLMLGQSILQTLDPKGSLEENQRKTEDALKAFRRCVALNPRNADGHLWLGESLVRSRIEGENQRNSQLRDEACSEFKKVLSLDPRNEQAKKAMERIGCQ